MKALTLTQPWATLVAIGAKRIETRSWYTLYRGPLAIHAAKGMPDWAMDICQEEPFRTVLRAAGIFGVCDLPRGAVLATCRLATVKQTDLLTSAIARLPEQELVFGDFSTGRYGWILDSVQSLPQPIRATGAQRLWNWVEV
jgi:hypothetical protein